MAEGGVHRGALLNLFCGFARVISRVRWRSYPLGRLENGLMAIVAWVWCGLGRLA